jgi:hypothetical protein
MEDEILSINPEKFGGRATDPYVVRLPDGHVRVTGSSIVFPETCPRCGASPANTKVGLGKGGEGKRTISLPFCKQCGWSLNLTRYVFLAIFLPIWFAFPNMKLPLLRWFPKVSPGFLFIGIALILGWASDEVFKLIFKPRVEVVTAEKDSIVLAFEDQMYAEKFVEINR